MENTPQSKSDQDKFLGVDGFWGQWAKLGFAGIVSGLLIYSIAYDGPALRRQAAEDRKLLQDQQEKMSGKSLEHGSSAVKQIADAIDRQTKAIDDNAERHRAVLRDGQKEMLELQRELTTALLGARIAAKKAEVPGWFNPDPLKPAHTERGKK